MTATAPGPPSAPPVRSVESGVYEALLTQVTDDQLARFGAALPDLRNAYRWRKPPPFHRPEIRGAYAFGYHPFHVEAANAIYSRYGSAALGIDGPHPVVVCLGAGPGGEADALLRHLTDQPDPPARLDLHLIDREPGWRITRNTTMGGPITRARARGIDVAVYSHTIDLGEGLGDAADLVAHAQLVTAQTMLSELPTPVAQDTLLDDIDRVLPADARLLLVDLYDANRGATALATSPGGLIRHTPYSLVIPTGNPPPRLTAHFWSSQDGRIRRGQVKIAATLLCRPGRLHRQATPDAATATPNQQVVIKAFRRFLTDPDRRVAVLTGKAGTGKTWVAARLADAAAETGRTVRILAPTGQAAHRISEVGDLPASTIHSAIYGYLRTDTDDEDANVTTVFGLLPPDPTPTVWLIDEASMVGNTTYDDRDTDPDTEPDWLVFGDGAVLTDLIRHATAHSDSRVVFIGDSNQLPPVEDGTSCPALDPKVLTDLTGTTPALWELTETMRQAEGSPILALADEMLAGEPLMIPDGSDTITRLDGLASTPAHLLTELASGASTVIAYSNAQVHRHNFDIRDNWQVPLDRPVPGDRLLVCRPDPRLGLVNGTEVQVVAYHRDQTAHGRLGKGPELTQSLSAVTIAVPVPAGGTKHVDVYVITGLLPAIRHEDRKPVDDALRADLIRRVGFGPSDPRWASVAMADEVYTALRATWAYARTAHRAQGSEWNRVVIDATSDSGSRWRYTAVTRAKSGIWLMGARRRAFTPASSAAEIAAALNRPPLTVTARDPLENGGLNLTATTPTGQTIKAQITARDGAPSKVMIQRGGHLSEAAEVALRLRTWLYDAVARSSPLPTECEGWVNPLRTALIRKGMAAVVSYRWSGDWSVGVAVVAPDGSWACAQIRYDGSGARTTTPPKIDGTGRAHRALAAVLG